MNDPLALGWRVGDRMGVATTLGRGEEYGSNLKDDPVALGRRVGDRVGVATTSRYRGRSKAPTSKMTEWS
jgi:hypothetical protein